MNGLSPLEPGRKRSSRALDVAAQVLIFAVMVALSIVVVALAVWIWRELV